MLPAKISKKSSRKPRIAIPPCAMLMDPDGWARFATDLTVTATIARGNKKGRANMLAQLQMKQAMDKLKMKQLLESTLGCADIVLEIMSNYSDEEFLAELMKYLINFPDLVNREACLQILMHRRVWCCNNNSQLEFLHGWLENEPIIHDTECVVRFSKYSLKFMSTIEKFSTVTLNGISITKRQLVDLMNASTSKIQHLKFNNFRLLNPESRFSKRIFRITPYLKKLTFDFELPFIRTLTNEGKAKEIDNPIFTLVNNLDLISSNIEELSFSNIIYDNSDFSLISHLGNKLTRLLFTTPPNNYDISTIAPNLEYYESHKFPDRSITIPTLCVSHPSQENLLNHSSEKVRKLILRNTVSSCKELRSFLNDVLGKCYPNCEELIIPETFLQSLSKEDLKGPEIVCSLKRIIVKHSSSTQPSKYGALKLALSFFFPSNTVFLFETIQKEDNFGTLLSSNRSIKVDCYEDVLFKRIESTERHFKVLDNSLITKQIRKIKKKFIKCIISNNFSKFQRINESLDILEGLKRNKQLMLHTIHQAIENYHDIFDNDSLFMSISEKFDKCMSILEDEYISELDFAQCYNKLELLFHQMIKVIEENGYPTKVLFNEQWFNEQIVEIYGFQSDEVQVYEDSQEEMEQASYDLMQMDEVNIDMEDVV
ncbi:predicted protein [Naegleria gruberi]|uniref:Predicted protein n=1 Tax=Naegleria gruberi TaxID=5762 RepID=D2VH87_NAEGR|nr:uncharacterized protein NAEGRDRAFT_49439 [Naegleria gruberi]EFC43754.1 predicted protein [Naegleria gruberi]|eukprot:XP_002676498.1 predicted protein [Naegleria gruberi strain NEG-M]